MTVSVGSSVFLNAYGGTLAQIKHFCKEVSDVYAK